MNMGQGGATQHRMWPYLPELLERPVPRYTSFPTAAEFTGAVGAADMEQALQAVSGNVSLYLHIPYCAQICWYCGCNTGAANKRDRLAVYLDSLHREIAAVGKRLGNRVRIKRVAFGGGSPNAISPTDFVRLIDALTVHTHLADPDWSVEVDPRTLTASWCQAMAFVGVTRASMGVQTFAPALQAAIGRVQPDAMIVQGMELLRAAGVSSINFDLMYGLPGQSWTDLEATLARTVELGADRIALFGYAHVPHLIPRQKRIAADNLPDQTERFAMAARGYDYLTARGYVPVGFDHFARPDDPMGRAAIGKRVRRNFQGFTDDASPSLIGLGASSISEFPDALIQNEKNAGRSRMLLSQDLLPAACGVRRSATDREIGAVISGLLCQGEARTGSVRLALLEPALAPFVERGLAQVDGEVLRILPHGLPYARTIAALFDPYRQDNARRFSSAV